jgi:hypothetical protein
MALLAPWDKRGKQMPELRGAVKGRQTQWATQFLVAAELIRRGYTVSFTQGNNTPVADLGRVDEFDQAEACGETYD